MHTEDDTYGAPRITAELNDGAPHAGRVNHKRVARVMRTAGIAGYRRKRRVKTTVADPAAAKVPDLLGRDFTAAVPNTTYLGDITYLPLATGGNLYLATVIDCCSRRVAGWAIADHMRTELIEDGLKAADSRRGALTGSIFHSITEVSTSQRISRIYAAIWKSPSRWGRWARAREHSSKLIDFVGRHSADRPDTGKPGSRNGVDLFSDGPAARAGRHRGPVQPPQTFNGGQRDDREKFGPDQAQMERR